MLLADRDQPIPRSIVDGVREPPRFFGVIAASSPGATTRWNRPVVKSETTTRSPEIERGRAAVLVDAGPGVETVRREADDLPSGPGA